MTPAPSDEVAFDVFLTEYIDSLPPNASHEEHDIAMRSGVAAVEAAVRAEARAEGIDPAELQAVTMEGAPFDCPHGTGIPMPIPAPSDEAKQGAACELRKITGTDSFAWSEARAGGLLTAAYAIDLPRLLAEARAEAEAARTAEIERLRERLTTMNECVRIYVAMREAETPARPGWLEEEVAATDALLAAHFNPEAES